MLFETGHGEAIQMLQWQTHCACPRCEGTAPWGSKQQVESGEGQAAGAEVRGCPGEICSIHGSYPEDAWCGLSD